MHSIEIFRRGKKLIKRCEQGDAFDMDAWRNGQVSKGNIIWDKVMDWQAQGMTGDERTEFLEGLNGKSLEEKEQLRRNYLQHVVNTQGARNSDGTRGINLDQEVKRIENEKNQALKPYENSPIYPSYRQSYDYQYRNWLRGGRQGNFSFNVEEEPPAKLTSLNKEQKDLADLGQDYVNDHGGSEAYSADNITKGFRLINNYYRKLLSSIKDYRNRSTPIAQFNKGRRF